MTETSMNCELNKPVLPQLVGVGYCVSAMKKSLRHTSFLKKIVSCYLEANTIILGCEIKTKNIIFVRQNLILDIDGYN